MTMYICDIVTLIGTYHMSGTFGKKKTDWRTFSLADELVHC